MQQQIPLRFIFDHESRFDTFVIGENAEAIKAIQALGHKSGERFIYLWGREGSGKTHLSQALCRSCADQQKPVAMLALHNRDQYAPSMLEGLERLSLVCVDDIHLLAADSVWEEGLFHFYNRAYDCRTPLVVTGIAPPAQLNLQLPDLKSRLGGGLVLQLKPLNDDQKLVVLQNRAALRGLELNEDAGRFLLNRHSRDLRELLALLDRLDRASLIEQRRLTIPFLRRHL
ncbi:MAG TPA: DnaA regulatory inactivator Hda [Gammaproteobacteria bacterium]